MTSERESLGAETEAVAGDRTLATESTPIASSELVDESGIARILHAGEIYTLRVTRNNRLILTK